tara:strand:+ start:947 stop:1195 length:249 start_codon:yes stop_codon:yes gene_type:complete
MAVNPTKRFMSKLKNSFRKQGAEIELTTGEENKQSLTVNGEEISFEWFPPIDEIPGDDLIEVLLKDCKQEIRSMLKKESKAT